MTDDLKETKPRYGWAWAIITIGMILAVILWLFTFDVGMNDAPPEISEEVASQQMDRQVYKFDVSANPIIVRPPDLTAFSDLFGSARMGELAGRDVDLQAVPVESVTGDTALWIGENAGKRVFVIFDELPTTAIDGRMAIEAGDDVNITGEVRLVNNIPDGVTVNIPADVQALVHASKLSKVE